MTLTAPGREWLWLAAWMAALTGLVAACGEEGQARLGHALNSADTSLLAEEEEVVGDQGALANPAPPETSAPQPAAPAPAPEPVAVRAADPGASVEEPSAGGRSTADWVLIVAIGVGLLLIVIIAAASASRWARGKLAARAELQDRLTEIVRGARRIHEFGSTDVTLAKDPDRMQATWWDVRGQMLDLESQIAALIAAGDPRLDHNLRHLGQCVAGLRMAEEGYVSARARSTTDREELTSICDQRVANRRRRLSAATEPVAAAMRR